MIADHVEREGKVFEFGDYPDKGFSLTAEEFAAANPDGGAGAIVDLEHFRRPHPLRGKLGAVVSTEVRGNALFARVRWPRQVDELLADQEKKVSCHFGPDKRLRQLDLVLRPRIDGAALFAAAEVEPEAAATPDGWRSGPEVVFAGPAHRHPDPHVRLVAQDYHDIAANALPGLCSGAATFARGDLAARHMRLVHTKSVSHGATCPGMSGRFSEETDMPETETQAPAEATFSAEEFAAVKKQLADLEAENRRMRDAGLLKDAAVFAENEVRAGRATVPERDLIARSYLRAALDDAARPADATFSVGDVTFSAPRLADLVAMLAARPPAHRGGERAANGRAPAPPARDGQVVFSGDDADPAAITDEDKKRLEALAASA